MKFTYRNIEYTFPASLSEITLGKRVDFYELHGKRLDELAVKISKLENEFDREAESNVWHLDMAVKSFSFFTGISVEEIEQHVNIPSMLDIYNNEIQPLLSQEQAIELQQEYEFAGEKWQLYPPELTATSTMALNEFIHAKEVVRQIHQLGRGKWDTLPYLCAIYFRKAGEPFEESFTVDGSERLKLMNTLPLDIAVAVGFFLTGILNIYMRTSQFSTSPQAEASTPVNTLTDGDGKHS